MLRTRVTALMLLIVCAAGATPSAQRGRRNRQPVPSALLSGVTALKCSFGAAATGAWTTDQAAASITRVTTPFVVTFDHIDAQEGSGMAIGLGTPAEVTVRLVGSNLHFLDIRQNGAIAITKIGRAHV